MITLKNVTKYFGRVKAVNDLSFSVNSSEVIGFLGPNGAGKTTTLRMMTGFFSPDRGSIIVDDINIERDPVAVQKKIGYLPENNPLYTNMLVSEFLDLAARLHQISPSERKEATGRVVHAVGIEEMFYRPIRELSKGFRQRVGIAAALIHKPDIIILDEPTEGLDPNQRGDIRALIKDLAKKHTVIMSTHVMQEASAVCSRLLILNKGGLVADGTVQELSAKAEGKRMLSVDIEGDDVEQELTRLAGGRDTFSVKDRKKNRFSATLSIEENREIRPDISKLAWKHHWILWDMHEEERKLEDIFQELTKE
ncbi:MAG: ATP-binding cassette domain-containing protein [Candidatus Moraniibacteriota bacterium]|nr:MAG: ATP-binding cassette domain-containing protein [Candidatus Moranbacteria bacterium]